MGYKPIKDYDFNSAPTDIAVTKISKTDRAEFHEGKWDPRDNRGQNYGIIINGQLLCYHQQFMDQSRLVPTLMRYKKKEAQSVVDMFMRLNYPFPYQVTKFEYNGFCGSGDGTVIMPYSARFKAWSGDPGVAIMECSDGEERLIPIFAMKHSFPTLPNDMTRAERSGHTQFFGPASKS